MAKSRRCRHRIRPLPGRRLSQHRRRSACRSRSLANANCRGCAGGSRSVEPRWQSGSCQLASVSRRWLSRVRVPRLRSQAALATPATPPASSGRVLFASGGRSPRRGARWLTLIRPLTLAACEPLGGGAQRAGLPDWRGSSEQRHPDARGRLCPVADSTPETADEPGSIGGCPGLGAEPRRPAGAPQRSVPSEAHPYGSL